MARIKIYRAKGNRIMFRCGECGARRSIVIPTNIRSRSIRCQKCGTLARYLINRREERREQQRGSLPNGREVNADLLMYPQKV